MRVSLVALLALAEATTVFGWTWGCEQGTCYNKLKQVKNAGGAGKTELEKACKAALLQIVTKPVTTSTSYTTVTATKTIYKRDEYVPLQERATVPYSPSCGSMDAFKKACDCLGYDKTYTTTYLSTTTKTKTATVYTMVTLPKCNKLGEKMCGDKCINKLTDKKNCGDCNKSCEGEGNVCVLGACVCDITKGFALKPCGSGNKCIKPAADPKNCGTCGNVCKDDQTCTKGNCKNVCDKTSVKPDFCKGSCFDFKTDDKNCGSCENVCAADKECKNKVCEKKCNTETAPDFCPAKGSAAEFCADFSKDNNNCGSCGNVCDADKECKDSTCKLKCEAGSAKPDFCPAKDSAPEFCANLSKDDKNCGLCGTVCDADKECKDSECKAKCPVGSAKPDFCPAKNDIAEFCADFSKDNDNCGSCGNVCDAGTECKDSECKPKCDATSATPNYCAAKNEGDAICFDFQTSNEKCGSCDITCTADQKCVGGTCKPKCEAPAPDFCPAATEGDDICFDFQTSEKKCGNCQTTCNAGEECLAGQCKPICGPNSKFPNFCPAETGTTCFDFKKDDMNCGECGKKCSQLGEDYKCKDGQCVLSCKSPKKLACPLLGKCVDEKNDMENCGVCGKTCDPVKETCSKGECKPICAAEGSKKCSDGKCHNLLNDKKHCGVCENECDIANKESCIDGKCIKICPASTPDKCNDGKDCVAFSRDVKNCGKCGFDCEAEGLGNTCVDGTCKMSCKGALPNTCGMTCVNFKTDAKNCGKCAEECETGFECKNYKCEKVCDAANPDSLSCKGVCVNPLEDKNNCGKCDKKCKDGQKCTAEGCVCEDSTKLLCPNGCFDKLNDKKNCGECGKKCEGKDTCQYGECKPACGTGTVSCPTGCINVLGSDNENCGECSKKCDDPQKTCVNGSCNLRCPDEGQTWCPLSQSCKVLKGTDRENCGVCGKTCPTGFNCEAGECKIDCAPPKIVCDTADVLNIPVPRVRRRISAGGVIDNNPTSTLVCVNDKTSLEHCGRCNNPCGADQVCNNGVCGPDCTGDNTLCTDSNTCFDLNTNDEHCGACSGPDAVCGPLKKCVGGACGCKETCNGPADTCIDFTNDNSNCGKCGKVCPADSTCTGSKCECDSGFAKCQSPVSSIGSPIDGCFKIEEDNDHCGTECKKCGTGKKCVGGQCQCDPAANLFSCDGQEGCFETQTDSTKCGASCETCGTGKTCVGGTCVCSGTTEECTPGTCFDTKGTNNDHCGSCNNPCTGDNKSCIAGICTLTCDETTQNKCTVDGVEKCILKTDPDHCGACDNKCSALTPAKICSVTGNTGECALECPTTENPTKCFTGCTNTDTDKDNCGACTTTDKDHKCSSDKKCEGGQCIPIVTPCDPGSERCENVCQAPSFFENNDDNCGSCGRKCADIDASKPKCVNKQCVEPPLICNPPALKCEDVCKEPSFFENNNDNCGSCGNKCGVADTTKTQCSNNVCIKPVLTCNTPLVPCGDVCVNKNTFTTVTNCGACGTACKPNEQCTGPADNKQCACPSVFGETCLDECKPKSFFNNNDAHCGKCNKACGEGFECDGNTCKQKCELPERKMCGGFMGIGATCTNIFTSNSHCGDCNKPCTNGKSCSSGQCACPADKPECKGGCYAPGASTFKTDKNNCGSCGFTCDPGYKCDNYACVLDCSGDNRLCPLTSTTQCVNIKTDANNCNGCDRKCTDPLKPFCKNGQCKA